MKKKRLRVLRWAMGVALVMALIGIVPAGQAQGAKKAGTNGATENVEARIERIEKGIEPVSVGKNQTPQALDLAALM